jgi:hypothetical protein
MEDILFVTVFLLLAFIFGMIVAISLLVRRSV